MKPIDTFDWKKWWNNQDRLLDYITAIDPLYRQELTVDDVAELPFKICPKDSVPSEEIQMLDDMPFGISSLLSSFALRYNKKLLEEYFKLADYNADHETLKLIHYLGLDTEKFWYFLLFCFDYSMGLCIDGIDTAESPYTQLEKLTNTLIKHCTDFEQCVFDAPISLKLSIKGQRGGIEIDNPAALRMLIHLWIKEKEALAENPDLSYSFRRERVLNTSTSVCNSLWLYYFANMFLDFFDTQEQIRTQRKEGAKYSRKELSLISRLIYLTRISRNKSFLDEEQDTLKGFLKQYKYSTISNGINSKYLGL